MICQSRLADIVGALLLLVATSQGCRCGRQRHEAGTVRLIGRFEPGKGPGEMRFAFGQSTLVARFSARQVDICLREASPKRDADARPTHFRNRFAVYLDDAAPFVLTLDPNKTTYRLADNLSPGVHRMTLVKRTEALVGEVTFCGLDLGPQGALLSPPKRAPRRIEFIGDSISAGYGVLGADQNCSFSDTTEDSESAFGPLVAQSLGAEATVVAWSGMGLSRNRDDSRKNTIGQFYRRVVPDDSQSLWSFETSLSPQAVVINAGTNDFGPGIPTQVDFESAYHDLLNQVRQHYPAAHIVCALGPILSNDYPKGKLHLATARKYIENIVAQRHSQGDMRLSFIEFPMQDGSLGYGCDWHPSRATQRKMAQALSAHLRGRLGW